MVDTGKIVETHEDNVVFQAGSKRMLLKCVPEQLAEIDKLIPVKVRVTMSGNQLISS